MCLNANVKEKKVEIITLEEDLIVYKLLAENFRSLYEDFPYELNKLYKTSFKRVEIRNGEISKGFHSYSDTKRIEEIEGSGDYNDGILVKCIIPKGTRYYYNSNRKQYISLKIIPLKKVYELI